MPPHFFERVTYVASYNEGVVFMQLSSKIFMEFLTLYVLSKGVEELKRAKFLWVFDAAQILLE